jgi:hypothetical protein
LAVRSVGFGTAFNVQIEPGSKDGIAVGFDRISFLEPGVEKPVECQVEEGGETKYRAFATSPKVSNPK